MRTLDRGFGLDAPYSAGGSFGFFTGAGLQTPLPGGGQQSMEAETPSLYCPPTLNQMTTSRKFARESPPAAPTDLVPQREEFGQEESAMEEVFAQVVKELNQVEDVEERRQLYKHTPVYLQELCLKRATELREAAARVLHMPVKAVRLQNAAEELQQEAGTWSLLCHLFGLARYREETKEEFDPVTLAQKVRAAARGVAEGDWTTFNCGRVVAWLEELAARALTRDDQGIAAFSPTEGVWRETRVALESAAAARSHAQSSLVAALDPDAVTRDGGRLHEVNSASEERIS
eukprot:CAMPEP_0118960416 /NCGR_PEP_ID=MMETSP1169-20130426/63626_1 /TAXON_ID=36882 /ORGANISM="Pyramimonas obovata, Strain CCMP722" /LENGTH=288 /DNA_ID=CAMNT_0006908565 /DNA_START=492 /DNA_END=1354 /DNA_ORIENTATION=+